VFVSGCCRDWVMVPVLPCWPAWLRSAASLYIAVFHACRADICANPGLLLSTAECLLKQTGEHLPVPLAWLFTGARLKRSGAAD
jgi:hypothetical protein